MRPPFSSGCWRGGRASQRASALLGVSPPQQEDFKRAYIGTELWVRSELASWQGSTLEADHLLGLAFEADPRDRWIAYAVSDRLLASIEAAPARGFTREQFLRKILAIDPWSLEAWRALWVLQRARGDAGATASRARILELSPLDREARAGGELKALYLVASMKILKYHRSRQSAFEFEVFSQLRGVRG